MYAQLEDGSALYRVRSNGDTIPSEWYSAGYVFQIYAAPDTSCVTNYTITGFKRNGARLPLRLWKIDRIVNAPEDLLGFNSRTVDVKLAAGDTLSFYRELAWKDPRHNFQDTTNYHSFDTLTYAVELVRAADSVRLALLDSMGVLPRVAPGAPAIHGTRPIMALVKYAVPATLGGTRAFVRVRARARGAGDYNFTRLEKPSVALWLRLADPYWIHYLTEWGQVYGKPSMHDAGGRDDAGTRLAIRLAGGSDRNASIDFATAPDGGATAVAVHDASGRLLFYPYSSPASSAASAHADFRFESNGLYLISLLHNGRFVRTVPITIGR